MLASHAVNSVLGYGIFASSPKSRTGRGIPKDQECPGDRPQFLWVSKWSRSSKPRLRPESHPDAVVPRAPTAKELDEKEVREAIAVSHDPSATKIEVLGAYCFLRDRLADSSSHNFRSAAFNFVPAIADRKKKSDGGHPIEYGSCYTLAVLRHLPILLDQWLAKDTVARLLQAKCNLGVGGAKIIKIVIKLPPLSPATQRAWEAAFWQRICYAYNGKPCMPGSYLLRGLEDFYKAIEAQWNTHYRSIAIKEKGMSRLANLSAEEILELKEMTERQLRGIVKYNLHRAFERVLENWPSYPSLAKYGTHLAGFLEK